ncbi:MAG TPA: urea ABC transporter ATP-binding subunit UrtE [Halothiobacillaceae bacterium]|nr:urea ABC transporter ATP-binding subunit UrtE [Halothiobacillaceae bacterium]
MFEVTGLRSGYGQSEVIKSLDLQVGDNETLAIMGRNGMGKTTLFKTLVGLIDARDGKIVLNGDDLAKEPTHRRVASGLAYVPQGRMIFPSLTVLENISTGLETVKSKRIPHEIFDLFPVLHDMRHRKGGNLSGGQQQQLSIARALVSNPEVLLLDEPTEGIQPSIIKDIAKTLNEISEMRKITIVVSEQILSFTLEIADRLMVIESGKIVYEAPRSECDAQTISDFLSV